MGRRTSDWRVALVCEVSVCLVGRHIPVPRTTQCRQSTHIFELMCDLLIDKFYGYFSGQQIFMYIVLFCLCLLGFNSLGTRLFSLC